MLLNEKEKDEFGGLLLGIPDGDRLRYVGQTDFGFNGQLSEILSRLGPPGSGPNAPFTKSRSSEVPLLG